MPLSDPEASFLDRLRAGDRAAFNEAVRRHKRLVYATARRVLGNHEDADEAAQQAFVRAWTSIGSFRGDAALSSWLVRIALNTSKSLAGRRRQHVALEEAAEPDDPAPASDERVGGAEMNRRVRGAVKGLPPRQREVVQLKIFSELTHREVAEVMGLSEGAVKAHLHQAVANLRRRMTETTAEKR
jgi:RNA polymerase sigma-70 factor (ECF subfamily)